MSNEKYNYIGEFVDNINNAKNETKRLNIETEKINYEIDERINKFKKRFEKLGEQLQSQTLIDYINKDTNKEDMAKIDKDIPKIDIINNENKVNENI